MATPFGLLRRAAAGLIQRATVPAFGGTSPLGAPGTMSFSFPERAASSWWRANWFQLGYGAPNGDAAMRVSAVYACIAVLSQEIARMELHMWRLDERTGKRTIAHPNFERVLRRPNAYQTRVDFWLHMMMTLFLRGNAYAVATRREGQIVALHPVPANAIMPVVVNETGEVWYRLGEWQLSGATEIDVTVDNLIPANEVLHLRVFCPTHPLIGMTPLMACGPAIAQAQGISTNSAAFFGNMSRPSGILTAPEKVSLKEAEAERVKERWRAATTEAASGSLMVLSNGYQFTPLAINAADAQLVEQYKMTKEDIASVFRVPMHMLGDLSKATFSNVDGLQRAFIVSGLGFYLSHIEAAVGDFFALPANEYAEFDVENAMMRPEFRERMEAFAKAVQGGIYTPNEVRAEEHLPGVPGGDTVFLQRQMTPVKVLTEPPPPPPTPTIAPPDDDESEDEDGEEGDGTEEAEESQRGLRRRRRAARTLTPADVMLEMIQAEKRVLLADSRRRSIAR